MPHFASPVKGLDDKAMHARLDRKDEAVIAEKAQSHDLMMGQEEIDEVTLDLDKDVFPGLGSEKEGDKVVVVLVGNVVRDYEEAVTVEFNRASVVHGKMPKLGSGERFRRLEKALEQKGAKNPGGLAAYIGRRKFGKERFQKLASRGR